LSKLFAKSAVVLTLSANYSCLAYYLGIDREVGKRKALFFWFFLLEGAGGSLNFDPDYSN